MSQINQKLYVITREDLSPAYQAVQSAHVIADFIFQHGDKANVWHNISNSIIILSAPAERDLYAVLKTLRGLNISFTQFNEPDLGYALTAVALAPGKETKQFCAQFPTALNPKELDQDVLRKIYRQERRLKQVVIDMENCCQSKGQSILEHGLSVKNRLFDLIDHLKGKDLQHQWKLPDWIKDNKDLLLDNLLDDYTLEKYTIFHDCGKPYCLEIDADRKKHFPNHAEKSFKTYMKKCGGDEQIGKLILMDMDIHILKSVDLDEFTQRKEAVSLLLTGLAEIHSNAEMFGGQNSVSFKIKWKQINKRGKAICNKLKELK